MLPKKIRCFLLLLLCAAALSAQSSIDADAEAEARDAIARMEVALNGSVPAVQPQITTGGAEQPWVNDPYTVYPRNHFIAAVGRAGNQVDAGKNALSNLVSIFGQSIQSEFSVVTKYSEAINKKIITVSENTQIRDMIITAASLDTLIGAEIGNVWDNGRGTVYAAAYMERKKAVDVYTELIRLNLQNIERLTLMSVSEKNTFDGYARYKLAALISELNAKYANVVFLCGGPGASSLNLTSAVSFNIEASNIIRNIPITFVVEGDRNNRIRDAFAKVLNAEGLRTGGNNSPYTLKISLELSEVALPANRTNKSCRWTISTNLIENETGTVLLPFSFTETAGHMSSYAGAEANAIRMAEGIIADNYSVELKDFLVNLIPYR